MKLKGGVLLAVGLPIMILLVGSMALPFHAFAQGNSGQANDHSVIAVLGLAKVQGEDVIVEILVEVQPGQNANEVARKVLKAQNARPFDSASLGSEGFTVTGLVWKKFPVVQYYNPANEITDGLGALVNTHTTLDGTSTSNFDIDFGGITNRCPSLVEECPGRQKFDNKNDVAWLNLGDGILGVAWSSSKKKEADIALSTGFDWYRNCSDNTVNRFDAQTVLLHENLHLAGLGHSEDTGSVMGEVYSGGNCIDDEEGLTYLYDNNISGSISGTVTDETDNPIEGASVVLEGTSLGATTQTDGTYTISNVPDPVTYTVIASADGFESGELSRQPVDGIVPDVDFALADSGGGGGGGGGKGGGPPSCVPKKFCP